jgi:TonB family protein
MNAKLAAIAIVALIVTGVAANAESQEAVPEIPAASDAPVVDMDRFCGRQRNAQRFYPPEALERRTEGQALLDCSVADGAVQECQVVEETPRDMRFGEAALRITCHARAAPSSDASSQVYERDGVRRLRRTIRFRLD